MDSSPLYWHRKERWPWPAYKPVAPYHSDEHTFFYHGDALPILSSFASESVDCVVTSPPYYGLRDYGVEGQLGREPTLDEYVAKLTTIFEEVRRVLTPWGTCWLNIGDSYNNRTRVRRASHQGINGVDDSGSDWQDRAREGGVRTSHGHGAELKEKDLMLVPYRVALALQQSGWWVRSAVIWEKLGGMPENVTDRPTNSYEHVFLLTKEMLYHYNADAIAEPRVAGARKEGPNAFRGQKQLRPNGKNRGAWMGRALRNRRNVWRIAPRPFRGAHTATMPPLLAERCILAGCREGGVVLDPFLGAGTTALVARSLNRCAVGIELSELYLRSALERLDAAGLKAANAAAPGYAG